MNGREGLSKWTRAVAGRFLIELVAAEVRRFACETVRNLSKSNSRVNDFSVLIQPEVIVVWFVALALLRRAGLNENVVIR